MINLHIYDTLAAACAADIWAITCLSYIPKFGHYKMLLVSPPRYLIRSGSSCSRDVCGGACWPIEVHLCDHLHLILDNWISILKITISIYLSIYWILGGQFRRWESLETAQAECCCWQPVGITRNNKVLHYLARSKEEPASTGVYNTKQSDRNSK